MEKITFLPEELGHGLANMEELMCLVCRKRYKNRVTLKRHVRTIHIKKYGSCGLCRDKDFSQSGSYQRHLRSQKHLKKLLSILLWRFPEMVNNTHNFNIGSKISREAILLYIKQKKVNPSVFEWVKDPGNLAPGKESGELTKSLNYKLPQLASSRKENTLISSEILNTRRSHYSTALSELEPADWPPFLDSYISYEPRSPFQRTAPIPQDYRTMEGEFEKLKAYDFYDNFTPMPESPVDAHNSALKGVKSNSSEAVYGPSMGSLPILPPANDNNPPELCY